MDMIELLLEVVASPRAKIVGKPLRKVKKPDGIIIGAVAQGEEIVIPNGDTVIQADDRVIVFALSSLVAQAEQLFAD